MMKQLRKYLAAGLLLAVYLGTICAPAVTHAISGADIKSSIEGTVYFAPEDQGNGCAVNGATLPSTVGGTLATGDSVFILGDSITAATKSVYQTTFLNKGITAKVDGSSSRSIRGAGIDGNKLSGLDAVATPVDKTDIAAAKVLIVALGTNGGNDAQSIAALVAAIRASNPSAPMYWIDTTVINRASYVPVIAAANLAIYNEADTNNYTVISWYNTVSPGGDAKTPTGTEADANGYINVSDTLHVHPTARGSAALANLVMGQVTGTGSTNPNGGVCFSGPAIGPGAACNVPGAKNEEKIWNFFKSKSFEGQQIQPWMAAGFLGNMQEEAHFEPRLVEYGYRNTRGEISKAGSPTSLDDFPPPDQPNLQTGEMRGQPGYGIIQWSGGRKLTLKTFAETNHSPVNSLCTQLEFLWSELIGPYKNSVLIPLLATTNVDAASELITRRYEIPGGINAAVGRRINNSRFWLAQFGSN